MAFAVSMDGGVPEDGRQLSPTFNLWPDEEHGPWLITFYWQMIKGRAECVGIEVTSIDYYVGKEGRVRKPPAGGWPAIGQPVTTGLLRSIKLSELVLWHRGMMSRVHKELFGQEEMSTAYSVTPSMRESTATRLRQVAEIYLKAWRAGKRPTKAVADELEISAVAAAKLVARARSASFLPRTSQGVAGGHPEGPADETEDDSSS